MCVYVHTCTYSIHDMYEPQRLRLKLKLTDSAAAILEHVDRRQLVASRLAETYEPFENLQSPKLVVRGLSPMP